MPTGRHAIGSVADRIALAISQTCSHGAVGFCRCKDVCALEVYVFVVVFASVVEFGSSGSRSGE